MAKGNQQKYGTSRNMIKGNQQKHDKGKQQKHGKGKPTETW